MVDVVVVLPELLGSPEPPEPSGSIVFTITGTCISVVFLAFVFKILYSIFIVYPFLVF